MWGYVDQFSARAAAGLDPPLPLEDLMLPLPTSARTQRFGTILKPLMTVDEPTLVVAVEYAVGDHPRDRLAQGLGGQSRALGQFADPAPPVADHEEEDHEADPSRVRWSSGRRRGRRRSRSSAPVHHRAPVRRPRRSTASWRAPAAPGGFPWGLIDLLHRARVDQPAQCLAGGVTGGHPRVLADLPLRHVEHRPARAPAPTCSSSSSHPATNAPASSSPATRTSPAGARSSATTPSPPR